ELFPAPAISRRRGGLPQRHQQIREVAEGARRAAAARHVAGRAEGEGSRLRRLRRGSAQISARLLRRPSQCRPRAETGEVLSFRYRRARRAPKMAAVKNCGGSMRDDDKSPISASDAKTLFADWRGAPALVLAVSGGPDSVALLWLAARWRRSLTRGPRLL